MNVSLQDSSTCKIVVILLLVVVEVEVDSIKLNIEGFFKVEVWIKGNK